MNDNEKIKIDDATILALAESGKSSRQIESLLGNIDHSTVCRRLKHLTPRQSTQIYKEQRAEIIAEKQRKLLDRGDKLSPKEQRDLAVAWGIYYDKERLERGLHDNKTTPLVMVVRGDQVLIQNITPEKPEKSELSTGKSELSTDR